VNQRNNTTKHQQKHNIILFYFNVLCVRILVAEETCSNKNQNLANAKYL